MKREVASTGVKRSKKSRIGEFMIWAAVALATAVIMVALSETLLPANF